MLQWAVCCQCKSRCWASLHSCTSMQTRLELVVDGAPQPSVSSLYECVCSGLREIKTDHSQPCCQWMLMQNLHPEREENISLKKPSVTASQSLQHVLMPPSQSFWKTFPHMWTFIAATNPKRPTSPKSHPFQDADRCERMSHIYWQTLLHCTAWNRLQKKTWQP